MKNSTRPYPGMRGDFVVILRYGDDWVAHAGSNTYEGARRRRRALPQWPADRVRIVSNRPGDTPGMDPITPASFVASIVAGGSTNIV